MPRPLKTFHDMVGQRVPVKHVTVMIDGSRVLAKPCPSLLLTAAPGYGKTTFAEAVAGAVGSTLYTLLAGRDLRPVDLCVTLYSMNYADVLFIDEAHALTVDAQQVLYAALDQQKVPVPREHGLSRGEFQSIAAITAILATNEPGRLQRALRSRLERIEFDPYTAAELKVIAHHVAAQEGIALTPQAARRIAETAQGVPRNVCRRVARLRLHYPTIDRFTQDHVEQVLVYEGIDSHGLSRHQRHYLRVLAGSAHGACSLERVAGKLDLDSLFIRQEIEPYLLDEGFIEMHGRRGRTLTVAGHAVVQEIKEALEAEEDEA
jgi:Holliday junction resolvasome RuvABC ATP-dependent DNA helicase subunit